MKQENEKLIFIVAVKTVVIDLADEPGRILKYKVDLVSRNGINPT